MEIYLNSTYDNKTNFWRIDASCSDEGGREYFVSRLVKPPIQTGEKEEIKKEMIEKLRASAEANKESVA